MIVCFLILVFLYYKAANLKGDLNKVKATILGRNKIRF